MASILIIDDESAIRGMLRSWLEAAGHTVDDAENGEKGLHVATESKPDLIITDIFMPDTEGIGVMRALRRQSNNAKIIAMSGGSGTVKGNYLELAGILGAAATICKPFSQKSFHQVVSDVLAMPKVVAAK
jgi:CheY-like chemotaxis protein